MNKDIKLLIESYFDDMFDEHDEQHNNSILTQDMIGNVNDQTKDIIIKSTFQPLLLTNCKTKEDIITCYKENSAFIQWYEKNKENIIYYLQLYKNYYITRSIVYIKENMLSKLIDYNTLTIKNNSIIEHTVFGLTYTYRFKVMKTPLYNIYNVYILYLEVQRLHASYMSNIFVDILFATDMKDNIINDQDIYEKIKYAYRTDYKSIEAHIFNDILPLYACNDIMLQIKHKPKIYPIRKQDITIMFKDKSIQKLSAFNNVSTVITKICAYCIANNKLDLLEWNTTNLAKWSLGIHDLQYYIDNMFNSPGAMYIYFKDLIESVKNYQENNK